MTKVVIEQRPVIHDHGASPSPTTYLFHGHLPVQVPVRRSDPKDITAFCKISHIYALCSAGREAIVDDAAIGSEQTERRIRSQPRDGKQFGCWYREHVDA